MFNSLAELKFDLEKISALGFLVSMDVQYDVEQHTQSLTLRHLVRKFFQGLTKVFYNSARL